MAERLIIETVVIAVYSRTVILHFPACRKKQPLRAVPNRNIHCNVALAGVFQPQMCLHTL